VSTGYDRLSAARTFDGAVQWQTDDRFDEAAPVAAGDTLYAVGEGTVAAFGLGGANRFPADDAARRRWSVDIRDDPVQGLAVADGALFVTAQSNDTTLYCLGET